MGRRCGHSHFYPPTAPLAAHSLVLGGVVSLHNNRLLDLLHPRQHTCGNLEVLWLDLRYKDLWRGLFSPDLLSVRCPWRGNYGSGSVADASAAPESKSTGGEDKPSSNLTAECFLHLDQEFAFGFISLPGGHNVSTIGNPQFYLTCFVVDLVGGVEKGTFAALSCNV